MSCASLSGGSKGPEAVGVVVITDVAETRGALLEGRPFRAIDMTDAYLLLTSDNLVDMLDLDAPEDWPDAARDAWRTGAAACRAKGVRPPWRDSDVAKECADALGPSVLHRLARARGASLLMVVDDDERDADKPVAQRNVRVVASTPSANDARVVFGARDKVSALLDELWAGGGRDMFMNQPSLPQPARPEEDVTSTGGFQPFDVVAVGGCVRPMPVSLDVSPPDIAMSNMIEHAWSRMQASARTGPATTCVVRAVEVWDGAQSKKVIEGSLDCADLPVARKTLARTSSLANDVANVAKALVDTVAFDGCKQR
jgi:hypothetical protein